MEEYKYDIPDNENLILDTESGKVLGNGDMTPMDVIRLIGKTNGIEIHDPDPKCKKCHGRGYLGIKSENKEPIPCECIFKMTYEQKQQSRAYMNMGMTMNRKDRRRYERMARKKKGS